MLTTIKLESIGNIRQGNKPSWVKRLIGFNRDGIDFELLKGYTDYSNSNSVGSRGIYRNYFLIDEGLYQVSSPQSWKSIDQYFCKVKNGEVVRLTFEEAMLCLEKQVLARTYMKRR